MVSVIFLISSGGGNLKFVKWASEMLGLNIKIRRVIADRSCGGLEFSRSQGIPHQQVTYKKDNPAELKGLLADIEPSVVITNMHKILDPATLQTGHQFINLHYSILPAFKGLIGMKPIQAARQLQSPFLGVTTHQVIEEVDSGPIIQQAVFPMPWNGRTDGEISDTVFKLGAITLLNSILDDGAGHATAECLKMDNLEIWFSRSLKFDYRELERKNIWQRITNDPVQ